MVDDKPFYLATTLLDKNKYDIEYLKKMYASRWDIEEYYKIINSNLSLKESRAKTLDLNRMFTASLSLLQFLKLLVIIPLNIQLCH